MTVEPRVPVPVRRVLVDVLDEDALQRAYAGVRARRAEKERAPSRRWMFALAAAAMLVVLALFVGLTRRDPGPLALASGAAFVAVEASAETEVRLDDGSTITLGEGARVVPLENGGERVVLLLERGSASFEVKPGGPRRWLVECGAATVEVVGTGFTVRRSVASLGVDVRHGVVLVRGEAVPDRIRRLTDGESIEIALAVARVEASATPSAERVGPGPTAIASSAPAVSAAPSARAPSTPWRDLAARGAFADAYELLGSSGIRERATSATPDELFLLADVARLSGHAGDAIPLLERIVREHSSDSRAALAAFTLGKLYGNSAQAAASMFERAIELGLPGSLQGDARARWVEACKRLADPACEARASGR